MKTLRWIVVGVLLWPAQAFALNRGAVRALTESVCERNCSSMGYDPLTCSLYCQQKYAPPPPPPERQRTSCQSRVDMFGNIWTECW